MKVCELKEMLNVLPKSYDDCDVILKIEPGAFNGCSPCTDADADFVYVPDTTHSGEVYCLEDSADDCCLDGEEWEKLKKGPRCFVLWPTY